MIKLLKVKDNTFNNSIWKYEESNEFYRRKRKYNKENKNKNNNYGFNNYKKQMKLFKLLNDN